MPQYYLPIEPRPYVRRTHQGRFSKAAMAYYEWTKAVRLLAIRAGLRGLPDEGVALTFHIAMPRSWSKRKRAEYMGRGHQTEKGRHKDLDNLVKSLSDALRPEDDGNIWHYRDVCKLWSDKGGIEIITRGP